jgi:Tol biopolymer transport system component
MARGPVTGWIEGRLRHGQPFGTIHVMDVATKTVASWSVPGTYPVWSPTGTQIAWMTPIGGAIMMPNADGIGVRALTPPALRYQEEPMSWSSDGKWLVARGATLLIEMVDTSTGRALPVGFTTGWYAPNIR